MKPSRKTRLSHDLSVPGGRPLCGADTVADPPHPVRTVTCPSCARLIADAARRDLHATHVRSDESEE